MVLSMVYCAGHAALEIDSTRVGLFIGLGLIALGSGGREGWWKAEFRGKDDEKRQPRASEVFVSKAEVGCARGSW